MSPVRNVNDVPGLYRDKPPLHIYRASPPTAARAPVVASGLAPRWAAQQPQQTHPSYPRHTEQAGFGAASPPNGGQAPSPHLPRQPADCGQNARCGERACPRWAAQQPQQTHPSHARHTEQTGFGAASPLNGGQAPSPHLPRQPADCGPSARCGKRACPALGCAAAPTNPPQLPLTHRANRLWGGFATQRGTSPLSTADLLRSSPHFPQGTVFLPIPPR
jgi:hypothetical protein